VASVAKLTVADRPTKPKVANPTQKKKKELRRVWQARARIRVAAAAAALPFFRRWVLLSGKFGKYLGLEHKVQRARRKGARKKKQGLTGGLITEERELGTREWCCITRAACVTPSLCSYGGIKLKNGAIRDP